ncbi:MULTISPECIES: SDR family NAD(P)-dependent oxidoreductase [unclassified Mycolicibacterium]|uniref:SDR family NAD(P)-dependent oxidoreductase n=1 Tax=unclassified Mycolicibacterium TaxID=2636767 RepID=UPI0012DD6BD5|nr:MULTISPECIES: SDR family oxidoreductase [unclassified Mycolicibacterium]MUL82633.1 SDR family oxidoreductase [Mycolicibacterium sp. CBMA 329]MUL88968.1 SDR family oxidoreductase [Mycolicibacterium sp. CBMA 331]MUL97535.1 SDR family oxidoreductase [Mycolicibacterium sp. CBMA 334]MUM27212.1 SDR family oxidoreductase [Mycolicibacterium sp. CBMA 295]MUM38484.1 SDR family oxidoreductase [Mycolicibacterium sp. CBMA 247]
MSDYGLAGRVALVTGAARGIGAAIADALGSEGAHLVISDIDAAELEQTRIRLADKGIKVHAVTTDVSDREQCEGLVQIAVSEFGGLDVLVNNAGRLFTLTGLEDTDDDDFDKIMAVNVKGPLYLGRAAVPHLRKSAAPRVIFISSQWGQVPDGHSYGYMTSKAAQLGLMKAMAKEFAEDGILVNAVTPGAIATRMVPEDRIEEEIAAIPIKRLGQPNDIADPVAFLASDKAAFITGQVLGPNGGALIVGI